MERIRELDGLRAIAILSVVAWHYLGAGDGPTSTPWRIFVAGRTGVDLFFVLSGYLISNILLANREKQNYFSAFYGRRSLRIFPVYFTMVAIYLVGRQLRGSAPILFDGPVPWWSYLVGLQNIWMTIEQSYGAPWLAGTWSLAVEEQFYLIFPLVVYFVSPRMLPRLLVALLVLCPIGRMVAFALGDRFGYYVLMPLRADILAAGALIAWLTFEGPASASARRTFQAIFWASAGFFPIYAWAIEQSDFNMAIWGHTYLTAFYGSMVFMVLDRRGAPRLSFLRSRIAAFFARISYALYLTHGCVLTLVFMAAKYRGDHTIMTWSGVAITACAFAISIAICAASYRFVEGPLIRTAHRRFRFGGHANTSTTLPATIAV